MNQFSPEHAPETLCVTLVYLTQEADPPKANYNQQEMRNIQETKTDHAEVMYQHPQNN